MGWGSIVGSILGSSGLAGDFSGGWSNYSSGKSKTKAAARQNYNYTRKLQEWQALNMPNLVRQGLEDAGYNPMLATGSLGSSPNGSINTSFPSGGSSGVGLSLSGKDFFGNKLIKEQTKNAVKQNEVLDAQKSNLDAQSSNQLAQAAQAKTSSAKNVADTAKAMADVNKTNEEVKKIAQDIKIGSSSAREAAIVTELLDQNESIRDMHRRQYMYKNTTRESNPFYDVYKEATYGKESRKHLKSARDVRNQIEDNKEVEERSKRNRDHSKSRGIESIFRK